MFRTMTFKKKVWSIPACAVAVFGLSLALTFFQSTRAARSVASLGAVRYPSLELTQKLDRQLKAVVDDMQSAVVDGDAKALSSVQVVAEEFRQVVNALAVLPGEEDEAAAIRTKFDAYLAAAVHASQMMLDGKNDQAPSAIAAMQSQHAQVESSVAAATAKARDNFKATMEASSAGIHSIVWATVGGALVVVVTLVLLSHFIVGSLWRQLGGDPGKAREFAKKIAAGDLSANIALGKGDNASLMAALTDMAARINFVVRAQTEMSREHERGNIDYRIDPSALPGTYADLARMSNELVDGHLKATLLLVSVLKDYGQGNFAVDMPELPGKKGELTLAAAEAKRNLLAINLELKRLVDAATSGDFGARGDAAAFQNMFGEMINGMNQVMAACETGITGAGGVLESLARGDLRTGMRGEHHGQFAQLQADANTTVAKLNEIIGKIQNATGAIDTAAREISDGNSDLSRRTENQAASLEETASSMGEITAAVKQNAENASRANSLAIGASSVAMRGGEVVSQVVETMSSIETSSKKIVDIIGVIDGIAFQTNILALNAAVEAARAGEQGRGFAVVASEVRNLAQRTVTAAKEIKELIDESVNKVGAGTMLVGTAGQTMREIVDAVKLVNDIMGEITTASADQSAEIESVNSAISKMDEATQQNAALVEEAAAAARSLQEQAASLAQSVAVFELAGKEARDPQFVRPTPAVPAVRVERRGPNRAKNVARMPAKKAAPAPRTVDATGSRDEWEQF